jgi:hypothetical protein
MAQSLPGNPRTDPGHRPPVDVAAYGLSAALSSIVGHPALSEGGVWPNRSPGIPGLTRAIGHQLTWRPMA